MQRSVVTSSSISAFTAKYEEHLLEVRGLSRATGAIHRQVVQKLLRYRFPDDQISGDAQRGAIPGRAGLHLQWLGRCSA